MKNGIPKRKYSEINVSVFETEEVNAGDTNIYDDAFGTVTPKCAKLSKLDLEAPSNEPSNASKSRNLLLTIEDQALAVLSTPTIKRKKPSSLLNADSKKINLENDKSINEDLLSLPTPTHSILKNTRHPNDNNEFSTEVGSLERHRNLIPNSETDVLKAQIDENDREDCSPKFRSHHATSNFSQNRSRESTPGKSLRFNVPKRLPPTLVELDDGMKLGGIENYEPITNGSPKTITASDSDNAILIPHENKFSAEQREEVELDTLDYDSRQDENESEISLDKLENELDFEENPNCQDYQEQKLSDTLGNIQRNTETLVSSNAYNTDNQTHKADEPKISGDEEIGLDNYNEEEESGNNVTKDEAFEDDIKSSNRTKSVTLADISVFQPDCSVADDEALANDGIVDIAKESLSCFTDQAYIEQTNENEINFEETKSTSDTEKLVNMSIYDTNEANEQDTMNNTLIRRIAHDIANTQAKDVDDSGTIENLSQTLTVPEMSVYEPISSQEDNNLDKTTIRKMAEEASSGSSEISHIDKNNTLVDHQDEIPNISIYESDKNDNKASNTTLIKELAHSAHGANATKSPDKCQEGTDACQFSIDMSVYIDKDKEISPDPEVTLNFPTAITPKEKEVIADTAEFCSDTTDVSNDIKKPEKLDFSTRDANVSVYDDINEINPSANCISFIKALATEKFEHMKNKESTSGPNKTRSFDFSDPYEATPAAAAKQRHLSKSDKNQSMCSPVFKFSKPISSIDEKETENTPMRSNVLCSDESLFKNELSVKDINSDQHGVSIDQEDNMKQINHETEESEKCTSTFITDRQDMLQIENKNSPKDKSGSRFSFANPIDSLAIDITIKRLDVSSHLENRFNNEESATKLQFDFSAAESLVDCSKSSSIEIATREKEQETSLIFDQTNKGNIIFDKSDKEKLCDDISIQDTVVEDSPDDNICLDKESGQPKTIESNSKDSSEQSKQTGKIIF